MVEPIKMSFAVWLLSGPRNCVLGRVGMFFPLGGKKLALSMEKPILAKIVFVGNGKN